MVSEEGRSNNIKHNLGLSQGQEKSDQLMEPSVKAGAVGNREGVRGGSL